MGDLNLEHQITAGWKGHLFRWGWLLFFAGIPFLGWSAPGLVLILIHWFVTRPNAVLRKSFKGDHKPVPKLYRVAVLGLLAAYAVSTIPAVSLIDALGVGIGFGLLLIFGLTYVASVEIIEPGWWKNYIWPVPLAGVVSALVGLYQYADAPIRVMGVHRNPNAYSTALLIGLYLGAAALSGYRDLRRWLVLPYAALMVVAMLTTGSRGAWVGTIAGAVVFACLLAAQSWKSHRVRAVALGVGGVIVSVLIIAVVYNSVSPAVQTRISSIIDIDANQDRVVLYGTMGRLIKAHPLFGVGMGNIGSRYAEFQGNPNLETFGTAHNYFLQVLGETGIFGMLFVLLLWASWFIYGWPEREAPNAVLVLYGLLAALLIRDQFDNALTNFYIAFLVHWLGATIVGFRRGALLRS